MLNEPSYEWYMNKPLCEDLYRNKTGLVYVIAT